MKDAELTQRIAEAALLRRHVEPLASGRMLDMTVSTQRRAWCRRRTPTIVWANTGQSLPSPLRIAPKAPSAYPNKGHGIGQVSDKNTSRREAILSILKAKGPSYIKDISTVIRDVSEKTIQRELQALVERGTITRAGERRWTTYALA